MNASGCYAGRNYHDHLTTKTRNGTGRGAGIAGGYDAGDHHAFRADAATTWANAQPAGVPAGAVVQRQCRKPGVERTQSEPEK